MKRLSVTTKFAFFSLLCVSLLFLPACEFAAGVGTPEEAKPVDGLAGVWVSESETNVNVFRVKAREDRKSYDVEYFSAKGSLAEPTKRVLKVTAQAWVTRIGGTQLLTAKVIRIDTEQSKPERPYMVFKIDPAKDLVVLTPLNGKFEEFGQAKTREAMEAAVKNHLDNPSAFQTSVDFERSTQDAVAKAVKLFE